MSHRNPVKKQTVGAHRNDVTLSKALSYVLRHAAPSLCLEPSPDGYIPVVTILSLNHPKFRDKQSGRQRYTVDDVIRVVETNEKQRFKLEYKEIATEKNVLCIRANQGHSFKAGLQSNQLLTPIDPAALASVELIVHGTTWKAWGEIQSEGLRRMRRNHIHFATGLPNDQPISGMRTSSEIYIYISGQKCAEDAVPFYRSDNGVILTEGVDEEGLLPLKYFEKVIEASSGKVIWKGE